MAVQSKLAHGLYLIFNKWIRGKVPQCEEHNVGVVGNDTTINRDRNQITPGSDMALPSSTSWSSVMMRMMLGRMFLRSLWMRPLRPWALVVTKARQPGVNSRASRATQASHRISIVSSRWARWEGGEKVEEEEEGGEGGKKEEVEVRPGVTLFTPPVSVAAGVDCRERRREEVCEKRRETQRQCQKKMKKNKALGCLNTTVTLGEFHKHRFPP